MIQFLYVFSRRPLKRFTSSLNFMFYARKKKICDGEFRVHISFYNFFFILLSISVVPQQQHQQCFFGLIYCVYCFAIIEHAGENLPKKKKKKKNKASTCCCLHKLFETDMMTNNVKQFFNDLLIVKVMCVYF